MRAKSGVLCVIGKVCCPLIGKKVGAMIDPAVHWLSKELDPQSRKVLYCLGICKYM